MDISSFPNLSAFVTSCKLSYDDDTVWIGCMTVEGKPYKAIYREKNDALELKDIFNKYIFTPMKDSSVRYRYMVTIDPIGNATLFSVDTNNGYILREELDGDKHGIHFK